VTPDPDPQEASRWAVPRSLDAVTADVACRDAAAREWDAAPTAGTVVAGGSMSGATTSRARGRAGRACAALASAVLATGCFEPARELDVDGVRVTMDADSAATPFAHDARFEARLERMMRLGAEYWSGSDDLAPWRGWELRFEASAMNCGSLEGRAVGCTDESGHLMEISTKDPSSYHYKWQVPCVEVTEVIHEMGHALIGDGDHRDRRWRRFGDLYRRVLLEGGDLVDDECRYHGWTAHGGYDGVWDG
jgi:hypothetical protein